jgi:hypothetical protein
VIDQDHTILDSEKQTRGLDWLFIFLQDMLLKEIFRDRDRDRDRDPPRIERILEFWNFGSLLKRKSGD